MMKDELKRLTDKYNRLVDEMNRSKRKEIWKRLGALLREIKRA